MTMENPLSTDADSQLEGAPPTVARLGPQAWVKENLFSTVFNGVLSVLFALVAVVALRGLLSFMFSEERRWEAVGTNLRLLFAGTYPQAQFSRIWFSLGILVVLTTLTLVAWSPKTRILVRSIAERGLMTGAVIALCGAMAPFSASARVSYFVIAAVILVISWGVRSWAGDEMSVLGLLVVATVVALPVLMLWVLPIGHHALVDGEIIAETGPVARTTSGPLTILLVLGLAVYLVVSRLVPESRRGRLRGVVLMLWFISPWAIVFLVLRDPDFDYDHILSTEIPIFAAYAIGGGLLLYWLTKPSVGEIGRIVAALTLVVSLATFLTPMLQLVRITFLALALFALAAPTFSGDESARRRYVVAWIATLLGMVWLITAVNSPSTIDTLGDWFPSGFSITLMVAIFTLMMSFPFGVILALARTSRMPIFRVIATTYIELVRGVPFITVLVFFAIMVPLFLPANMAISRIAAVIAAYSLFSAAYLAENVRGGLQSISRGQHEAAEALGMTGLQKTIFIVLPQALRASIPPLVGQTIGTFKETTLLAIIGVFDFLYVARNLIPTQSFFLGALKEGLLVICAVYWLFTYNMSKASQRLERKLGVGER